MRADGRCPGSRDAAHRLDRERRRYHPAEQIIGVPSAEPTVQLQSPRGQTKRVTPGPHFTGYHPARARGVLSASLHRLARPETTTQEPQRLRGLVDAARLFSLGPITGALLEVGGRYPLEA